MSKSKKTPQQTTTGSHHAIDLFNVDGKASIEQQIEVHVHDLFDVKDNKSISLEEVLEGLRYVMDFRIKGGCQRHLDIHLMKRLCEALLLNTGHTEGHLLRKRTTPAADMAFFLFGDFLEEVIEFRTVVSEKDVYELREQLKVHYRCQPSSSTPEQKRGAIAMVQLLTHYFPGHISDWRDLVKESEQSDMEELLASPLAVQVASEESSKMPRSFEPTSFNNTPMLPPPQALYFDRPVEKLMRMFPHTDPERGLPSALVPALREQYGSNRLPDPPKPSAIKMLWAQLTDFMVLLLLAAAVVEAGQQEFNSMAVLLIVVIINTIIGFSQEWKASKTLSALMDLSVPKAQIIRDGQQQLVDSVEIVPGDLIVLEEGNAVPADVRLIHVAQLEIVESILTGESLPVAKKTDAIKAKSRRIPLGDCLGNAFMSTTVAKGRGKGIVVRTGEQTEIGKISMAIQAGSKRKTETPIQRRLSKLGKYLVLFAIVLCALVVIIGIAWKQNIRTMINIGLSLAVSVIPEGLVAVTTVTMALGVRRMAASQCIVRTLPAVEALGSVTVICSDKTGTLTEGKMGTAELWTADNALYRFTESTSLNPGDGEIILEPADLRRRMIHMRRSTMATTKDASTIDYAALRPRPIDRSDPTAYPPQFLYAMMVSALCNNSTVRHNQETNQYETVGDPTEIALTVAAQKANAGRNLWTDLFGFEKTFERAFDSERKLMSTAYESEEGGISVLLCKGAPEELLRKCVSYMVTNPHQGKEEQQNSCTSSSSTSKPTLPPYSSAPMTDAFATQVSDESSRMASQGLRILGLALKTIKKRKEKAAPNNNTEQEEEVINNEEQRLLSKDPCMAEDQFVFIGLIGMLDPPKQGVQESVAKCQQAGIKVTMITGDHVDTAIAIASKLGIYQPGVHGMSRAILGRELDLLSEDAIIELDPFPNVFARVSPDNKLSIVKALQKRGELVAMTGDGVNDAPAIRSADVGVAMGQAGTEITKQAADLVLINDNFSTIVDAVEEGRHVFDNILKFIVYLLSCNGSEIFLMLICTIANINTPLTVMMILWGNIIADIPPAMALGVEPKERYLMQRPPRDPTIGVVTRGTWIVILLQSFLIATLTLGAYLLALFKLHYAVHDAQSLAFACLVTLQLLHSFLSRSIHLSVFETGILSNRWMILAGLVSFAFLIMGIYVPGMSTWLDLTFVNWVSWVIILVCCAVHFVIVELEKLVVRYLGFTI